MNDEPRSELGQQQEPTAPTGPASLPEPAPAPRPPRPSRRRRLLVASVVLVVASLAVGVSVLLVSRQPLSGGRVTTTTAASAGGVTSPAGAGEPESKDFGRVPGGAGLVDRFDASVFLLNTIDAAQQELMRRRVAALPFVEQFAYESQAEAFEKYRDQFRNQPRMLRGVTPRVLPASFRVVLHEPRQFSELFREFCPQLGPDGKPACVKGIDQVVDQHQVAWDVLAGPWVHTTDAAVFLASGVDPNRQEAIRRDLEALPLVEQVDFESAAAARGRFQQSGVQDPIALDKVAFDSFRVRLRDPRQFPTLYGRLCRGRWTFSTKPVCKPGVSFVIANPRSVYYGLER
jgi:cell division protein FtsX